MLDAGRGGPRRDTKHPHERPAADPGQARPPRCRAPVRTLRLTADSTGVYDAGYRARADRRLWSGCSRCPWRVPMRGVRESSVCPVIRGRRQDSSKIRAIRTVAVGHGRTAARWVPEARGLDGRTTPRHRVTCRFIAPERARWNDRLLPAASEQIIASDDVGSHFVSVRGGTRSAELTNAISHAGGDDERRDQEGC
jgi:hypothetical protein